MREITPLKLNQSLFTRRDKWKDVPFYNEFLFCLALCCTWLALPKRRRTGKAAKAIVEKIHRRKLRCWLRGEIEPGVPERRWDEMDREREQQPPAQTTHINWEEFKAQVEATAAQLPPKKRDECFRKVSEGVNRAGWKVP